MNHKSLITLTFVLFVGIVTLWGCPKKAEVSTAPESQTNAEKSTSMTTQAPTTEAKTAEATSEVKSEGSNEKAGAMAEGPSPYILITTSPLSVMTQGLS